ncbi:hypothetical protein BC832DRAFT_242283 [Gaertneriomyces semiglobifer]|nr:hypothetical protein BC832DRAFT_242283 [Gaertneriomyces semiglobifer]
MLGKSPSSKSIGGTPAKNAYPLPLSVEVPDSPDIPGEGKPRCHYLSVQEQDRVSQFGTKTMPQLFEMGRALSGDRPFLGRRRMEDGEAKEYVWQTYNEVAARVDRVGSALVDLGLQKGGGVGIFAKNCPEYVITEFGAFRQGGMIVPIYDTLVSDETVLAYMLNLTECAFVFTTSSQVPALLSVKSQVEHLKYIITFDAPSPDQKTAAAAVDVKLLSLVELEEMGAQKPAEPSLPAASDVAWICFTSGTTGMPKGAQITHGMCSAIYDRFMIAQDHGIDTALGSDDVLISYLPMAHVFEMACQATIIGVGARIGFYQGDVAKLVADMQELRPTLLAGTPRVYNRIYDRVMSQVSKGSKLKAALFHAAYNTKISNLQKNSVTHALWDRLVFKKLRLLVGGKLRYLVTGAAPISREVLDFLKVAFSIPVIEGYGQTETMAGTTVTYPVDVSAVGTVGVPIPGVQVKLVDVPDMNYLSSATPPAGEICLKGVTAFPGYYKAPEKTAETLDSDGWIHTGDIGIWTPEGNLKIIDRKKNLFKLSQGEYVSPEKIEGVYTTHELIESIYVTGESTESHVVAIIVPPKQELLDFVHSRIPTLADKGYEELCNDVSVRKEVLKELTGYARRGGELKGFEIIKDLVLESKPFADAGLLTPTFKVKRHDAKVFYQDKITDMYKGTSSAAAQ